MNIHRPYLLYCQDMESNSFNGQILQSLDLQKTPIVGKEFLACRIEHCDFTEADLSRCVFEDCRFISCNFSNPVVARSRFAGSTFEECKFVGVNFRHCDQLVFDVEFEACRLQSCNFSELKMKEAKFRACKIDACFFEDSYLVGAIFDDSIFDGTLFHACDLTRASFRSARGYAIDPRVNKVEKAVFSVPDVLALVECFGVRIEGSSL
jgi:fluoroquinolone resistance protein